MTSRVIPMKLPLRVNDLGNPKKITVLILAKKKKKNNNLKKNKND